MYTLYHLGVIVASTMIAGTLILAAVIAVTGRNLW